MKWRQERAATAALHAMFCAVPASLEMSRWTHICCLDASTLILGLYAVDLSSPMTCDS